ncbi:hypothetical protein ACOSQ2_001922 [Xanthoceras sorbifolium]
MKREGRQHGLVRTYGILPSPWNPRPDARFVNRFDSPPTSGLFTKVPPKPTNHSKFTGKCGKPRCTTCHLHPACKSKEKTKGTQKLNSRDMVSNYKHITWRVVDGRPGLNFSGFSASGILDHLGSHDYMDDEVNDYDDAYDQHHDGDGLMGELWSQEERVEIGSSEVAHNRDGVDEYNIDDDHDGKVNHQYDDDDDDEEEEEESVMSFCDVGMAFDQVNEEDEGWCLVGEM